MVYMYSECMPNNCFSGNLLVVHYPKQFTLLSRKYWIAGYHPIWCKLLNTNIFMSDVQTFQSVQDGKCNLEWEKTELHWWTKPSQAPHTPQDRAWLTAEYIGSPLPLLASPWQQRWGRLAAIPAVCAGVLCEPRTCGSNRRMHKPIRNTFHTHSFKFQPGPGRLLLQLHSPPD